MAGEPDLSFDIDALFKHMGIATSSKSALMDWHFSMSSSNVDVLQKIAEEQQGQFDIHLEEDVEIIDVDNNCVQQGDPELVLIRRGQFTTEELKNLVSGIMKIAEANGVNYAGVNCYDPIDADELFGWLPVEDAGWRLRHMTDCGLEENAELPWTFFIVTADCEANQRVCEELRQINLTDVDVFDEPDDNGLCAVCVFVDGRNNEIELNQMAEKINEILIPTGGTLRGIQFYDRGEFEEVFFGDDK